MANVFLNPLNPKLSYIDRVLIIFQTVRWYGGTGGSRGSHGWVTGESWGGHGWVMGGSRVGHGWVTGGSRVGHEGVTGGSRVGHGGVTGGHGGVTWTRRATVTTSFKEITENINKRQKTKHKEITSKSKAIIVHVVRIGEIDRLIVSVVDAVYKTAKKYDEMLLKF